MLISKIITQSPIGFAVAATLATALPQVAEAQENAQAVTHQYGALNTYEGNGRLPQYFIPSLSSAGIKSEDYICPEVVKPRQLQVGIVTQQNDILVADVGLDPNGQPTDMHIVGRNHHTFGFPSIHYAFDAAIKNGQNIVTGHSGRLSVATPDNLGSYIDELAKIARSHTCNIPQKEFHTIYLTDGTSVTSWKSSPQKLQNGSTDSSYFTAHVRPAYLATIDVNIKGRDASTGQVSTYRMTTTGLSNHVFNVTVNGRPAPSDVHRPIVLLGQYAIEQYFGGPRLAPEAAFTP